MKFKIMVLILSLCLAGAHFAFADDVIKLKDGSTLRGHIGAWSGSGAELYFDQDDERSKDNPRWVSITEIESVQFGAIPFSKIKEAEEQESKKSKKPS